MTLLRGARALEEVAPAWDRLARDADAPPFLARPWAEAWLRNLGGRSEPWIFLLGDPPTALVPLVRLRRAGVRTLLFLGHGVSDYLGVLADPSAVGAAEAFASALRGHARHFDLALLRGIYETGLASPGFRERLPGAAVLRPYEVCPLVDCESTWEVFLAGRKKRFRANLKLTARQVERLGHHRLGVEAPSPALFEEMVAVERHSWKWTEGRSMLRRPALRAFLKDVVLAPDLPKELWTLRTGDGLAAFAVVLLGREVRYYYLPSFRSSAQGAGSHLLAEIVRQSFGSQFRTVDLLQGDEPYKLAWATRTQTVYELVCGRGWRGLLGLAAVRGRWKLAESARLHALWGRLQTRRAASTSE